MSDVYLKQKTEDRGQRTEDRRQRTEDRGQKTELVSACGVITENLHPGLLFHLLLCPASWT